MSVELTWLGHATWLIKSGAHQILLDPFLADSPTAPMKPDEVDAEVILVSHGHSDHVADVAEIANRCNSKVVACYEIAQWFATNHSVKDTVGMNISGSLRLPFCSIKMTQALHSSQLPDGSCGGVAAGFVLTIDNKRIYFACDTGLFSDMKLIGTQGLDLAVLPIGDLFTMGPEDSVMATTFLNPKQVLPSHYNTWPPIEQDAAAWARQIKDGTSAEPIVLEPGQTHTID